MPQLEISYRAPAAAGLVWGAEHVYTAFQSCHWMPCTGPELGRASIRIQRTLPPGHLAVASEPPALRPYPLHTLGFAAGRFTACTDPADPRLRHLAIAEDEAGLRAKFRDSARLLAFFEDKAGLPLPQAHCTQVLLPGGVALPVRLAASALWAGRRDASNADWVGTAGGKRHGHGGGSEGADGWRLQARGAGPGG